LANLGNLCQRALKYAFTNYEKQVPKVTEENLSALERDFLKIIDEKYKKYVLALEAVEIKEGLKLAMEISHLGNKYLQDSKFWEKENVESGRYYFNLIQEQRS
jgi:methionyl-tRNA synthetase